MSRVLYINRDELDNATGERAGVIASVRQNGHYRTPFFEAPDSDIADRLARVLENPISVAERCDGWESFPGGPLDDARLVLMAYRGGDES